MPITAAGVTLNWAVINRVRCERGEDLFKAQAAALRIPSQMNHSSRLKYAQERGNHGYLFGDRRPSGRELFFRKNSAESLTMPEEKDYGIGAKRGKIQYDHDQREKIHSHCQSDGDMHPQNAN